MPLCVEYINEQFLVSNKKISEIMARYRNASAKYAVLVSANVQNDNVFLEISVYSSSVSVYITMYEIVVKFNESNFIKKSDNQRMFNIFNEVFDMVHPLTFAEDLNETLSYVDDFHELFTKIIGESDKLVSIIYGNINDLVPPIA